MSCFAAFKDENSDATRQDAPAQNRALSRTMTSTMPRVVDAYDAQGRKMSMRLSMLMRYALRARLHIARFTAAGLYGLIYQREYHYAATRASYASGRHRRGGHD